MTDDNKERRFMTAAQADAEQIAELIAKGMTPRRIRDDAMQEFGNYTARYAFELTAALGHLLNQLDNVNEAAQVCAALAEEFSKRAMAASEDVPVPPTMKQ